MSSSKSNRLARWSGAALALSLVSGCSTSPKPTSGSPQDASESLPPVSRPRQEEPPATQQPSEPQSEPSTTPSAPPPPPSRSALAQPKPAPAPIAAKSLTRAPAEAKAMEYEAPSKDDAVAGVEEEVVGGAPAVGRAMPAKKKEALAPPAEPPTQGNRFTEHTPNAFTETAADRFSTFAVDVDTASYTVARRYLNQNALPPRPAVRVEEFVNYFKYRYTPPERGAFGVHLEGAPSPFDANRHFVRVGIQGKVVSRSQRKPAHLVFLVDTSGSMNQQDKLPLAKEAMKLAVKNLNENDTVALVTYAGGTREVLTPTPATNLERIYKAIDSLESGGGTAMGSGMELAYKHAVKKASGSVVSRVVVLTDGDANIGQNLSADDMLNSIQGHVKEGVTLSAIGFGMGNYRDDLMEKLADKGNGNCFYIDSYKEAKKVFEQQLTGTLEVIAKDVKVQVEFDPKVVRRYRLVGYENRDIADKDFRDDKVDAGEIGAGHSVTALYEVELTDAKAALGTVRIRAKTPTGTEAAEQAFPLEPSQMRASLDAASSDFRFALAVAATADVLRGGASAQKWNLSTVQKLAEGATDGQADRVEFTQLLARARSLLGSSATR
ncbi:vWA domain-containing protein [Melittangium boletus]|uniref:VWA domain-containing protein n=1 Tax=Melittangium boletus DSM 14713 TaxID=1294270 RepID=A0A250IQH4_9BACT|nr:von Willebrand factor type A domain-containing protein [Melittangium boletus]ATB33427.1 VWA domain-containing protein [Melittangium boletus DSM 14713]